MLKKRLIYVLVIVSGPRRLLPKGPKPFCKRKRLDMNGGHYDNPPDLPLPTN